MLKSLSDALIALLIGFAGGAIFAWVGFPLPWTLGAMAAAAVAAVWADRWPMPAPGRDLARPVVGVLAGSTFTPDVAGLILSWWPAVLTVAFYSLATSATGYLVFTRLFRLDPPTAYFAAAPGGLGELAMLGSEFGGKVRTIVLVHSVRIVGVVFAIPLIVQLVIGHDIVRVPLNESGHATDATEWLILLATGLAGYGLGRYARLPGGVMVATMLCSALVHVFGLSDAAPPAWLVIFAQVLIGSVAGGRFAGLRRAELQSTVLIALAWSAFLLLSAAAVAVLGGWALAVPPVSFLLAVVPGGTAEMIIITYALGAEVAFVSICQVARIFLVLTFAPLFFRFVKDRPQESTEQT